MSESAEKLSTFEKDSQKTIFGFWIYIMTDCVLFATLFATYAVLHKNTFGGPSGQQIFNMPYILAETMALLFSSFCCGLGLLSARNGHKNKAIFWLCMTFILGATFLSLEISDFHHLVAIGDSWRVSGFLTSFFTLVGTHGLHITVGLIWLSTLLIRIYQMGLSKDNIRKLTIFTIFWHFLDLIWIFIFTIVYLFGHLGV